MCPQTSGAYQNINQRCRESRTDHQGPRKKHQGQVQVDTWLAKVHDTSRTGLPFRIFHQSRPGILLRLIFSIFLSTDRITYLIVSIKFTYITNISSFC